jgi:UDP-glucuronate 4-epimerase
MNPEREAILVTGAAGFIGMHLARRLLQHGRAVIGVDNLDLHHDPQLKQARLQQLTAFPDFSFLKTELADREAVAALFSNHRFGVVVHLAAQAGVRHSLSNPHAYIDANIVAFANVLEGCRHAGCGHLLYASSSSVYGANTRVPFRTSDNVDHPVSLYGATKKANELMAHAYSHLYGLATTGLRFFTVYGPWGRPDMATSIFAKAIVLGEPVRLFNYGRMRRDYTYVDDVTEAVERLIARPPTAGDAAARGTADPARSDAPWRIYNIGNNRTVEISELLALLEREFGRKATTDLLPMQPGDVPETFADIDDLIRDIGFRPEMPFREGIHRFAAWFREYYRYERADR